MIVRQEELWDFPRGKYGLVVVTTNGCLNAHGALVMGAGAALEAKRRLPGVDAFCGGRVQERGRLAGGVYEYGFLPIYRQIKGLPHGFGIFQTKGHFREPSRPDLIALSSQMLMAFCEEHPDWHIRLNFPGVGLGGLQPDAVLPLLSQLPDTVILCRR